MIQANFDLLCLAKHRRAKIRFLCVIIFGALATTASTDDANAQVLADPRIATRREPAALPGEFAFQNVVTKQYVSANGGLRMSSSRGATEKFRIVPEPGSTSERIRSASSGTYVRATPDGKPASLVSASGDGTVFSFSRDGTGTQSGAFLMQLKAAPGWFLQQFSTSSGPEQTVSARNYNGDARAYFSVTKCGDIGSGQDYVLRAVGAPRASAVYYKFLRQSDGTYAMAQGQKYFTATGGGGNAPGKGADGNPIEWTTSLGPYAKFKFIDQGNCTYAIQTATGWHFGMKAGSSDWNTFSTRISDPNAAPSIGYVAFWELTPWSI